MPPRGAAMTVLSIPTTRASTPAAPLRRMLPALACALAAGAIASPASAERYVLDGARIAVYNLAGKVTLVPSDESQVAVEVVRGGADAGRLRVLTGAVGGRQAL